MPGYANELVWRSFYFAVFPVWPMGLFYAGNIKLHLAESPAIGLILAIC